MTDHPNADDRVDNWFHSQCSCPRPNSVRPAGSIFKIECTTCLSDEVRKAEAVASCRATEALMAHLERPKFVPGYDESGRPRGFMKWNRATRAWEYWLECGSVFAFSDFGLQMIIDKHQRAKETGRIEVVVDTHSGHLVLRSVPIKRLRWYVKEKYGLDIP